MGMASTACDKGEFAGGSLGLVNRRRAKHAVRTQFDPVAPVIRGVPKRLFVTQKRWKLVEHGVIASHVNTICRWCDRCQDLPGPAWSLVVPGVGRSPGIAVEDHGWGGTALLISGTWLQAG